MKYSFSVRVNIREVESGYMPRWLVFLIFFPSEYISSSPDLLEKKIIELFKWYLKRIRSLIAKREGNRSQGDAPGRDGVMFTRCFWFIIKNGTVHESNRSGVLIWDRYFSFFLK